MAIKDWSTTAAGNSTVGSINWAEGQAPSSVNDSAREMMAELASFLQGIVNVKDYGALGDGSTDDSAAIQSAIDYAETFDVGVVYFPSSDNSYVCNSGLTLDINVVTLEGNGARFDFSGMTTGTAITPIQSSSSTFRNSRNTVHPIRNCYLIGPGVTVDVYAIIINDPSATLILSSGLIENCSFVDFAHDISLQNGAFTWIFRHCTFETITGGPATTASAEILVSSNAGERNIFEGCMWVHRNKCFLAQAADADTYFIGCSFDGNVTSINNVMDIDAGSVHLMNCHIEQRSDTANWLNVAGATSRLELIGCEMLVQGAKANFSPFVSDSTAVNGGIVLQNFRYRQASTMIKPLIDGTGRIVVENISVIASQDRPRISSFSNYLAHGGFEDATDYTNEWSLTAGAIRSIAESYVGSASLSYPGAVGTSPIAQSTVPAKPGQFVFGELWYKVSNITGTSGQFVVRLTWRDVSGNALSSSTQITVTTNVASWTRLAFTVDVPAPAGTRDCNLYTFLDSVASGTPTAYIDEVIIQVI